MMNVILKMFFAKYLYLTLRKFTFIGKCCSMMSARKVLPVPELPRMIKTLTGREPSEPSARADENFSR